MAFARVNSASIGNGSSAASAITAAAGVAVPVGSLIVAVAASNGTHVTNGMAMSDAKNGAYNTLLETDNGGSSTRWQQSFYKLTTVALLSTDLITFTPYAASAANAFVVDIFSGGDGTISRAAVGNSNTAATTSATPALATAPPAGDLVLTLHTTASGTSTPPSPYVAGSNRAAITAAIGYVLSASGSLTYGGNWTITNNTSAAQTVSFTQSGGAAAPGRNLRMIGNRR